MTSVLEHVAHVQLQIVNKPLSFLFKIINKQLLFFHKCKQTADLTKGEVGRNQAGIISQPPGNDKGFVYYQHYTFCCFLEKRIKGRAGPGRGCQGKDGKV